MGSGGSFDIEQSLLRADTFAFAHSQRHPERIDCRLHPLGLTKSNPNSHRGNQRAVRQLTPFAASARVYERVLQGSYTPRLKHAVADERGSVSALQPRSQATCLRISASPSLLAFCKSATRRRNAPWWLAGQVSDHAGDRHRFFRRRVTGIDGEDPSISGTMRWPRGVM